MSDDADRPVLRLVRGAPTPDELAALVSVVAAAGSAAAAADARRRTGASAAGWAARERTVRGPLPSGGWRSSGMPR